jgi:hypothetical protein
MKKGGNKNGSSFHEALKSCLILLLVCGGFAVAIRDCHHEDFKKKAKTETTPSTPGNINGLYSTDYDGNGYSDNDEEEEPVYVWICTGEYSHAYHSDPDCEGLQYCKGEIEMIEWEEAQDMGRTPCHFCHDED